MRKMADSAARRPINACAALWLLLAGLLLAPALAAQPAAPQPAAPQPAASSILAAQSRQLSGCDDGVVKDDGSAETGYGWVPSVIDGRYVQAFHAGELQSSRLASVCICWLRTRADDDIDFDVVIYADDGGIPAATPLAIFPATATGVPEGITGQLYEVDVSGLHLPAGTIYVGARWNPSVDQYFFVCVDTSPATPQVEGFYVDDRASGWAAVIGSPDWIFRDHRAMMVRATTATMVVEVPLLGVRGLVVLALVLALAGVVFASQRRNPRRLDQTRR